MRDPSAENEPSLSAGWSVPWSDLMMVMFVLFAVLYAYQAAERDVREALRDSPRDVWIGPGELFEQSRALVREAGPDDLEVSKLADRSVLFSLHGPLLFDLGKADLRPELLPILDRVAGILRRTPNEVRVIGHTDPFPIHTPEYPTNWELSAARASRVARYLIHAGDIDAARFTVVGHAMYRPTVPNTTASNKARNRRVEIVVTADMPEQAERDLP